MRDSIPERVVPTQRDGSESEISHTFPVPAVCTGPIPVELLRWKFVEGRKIELKNNAGLELPSNIGELGESVTKIDLTWHGLRGVCCAQHPRYATEANPRFLTRSPFPRRAGAIPESIGSLTSLLTLDLSWNELTGA